MIKPRGNKIRTGVIYKWTSPSGKSYIGQTLNQKRRYKDFFRFSRSYAGWKIDTARKKYGPENFTYEILFIEKSNDVKALCKLLDVKEIEYIKLYNSVENGYNLTYGGQNGYNKTDITEKTRKRLSEATTKYYKTHKSAIAKPIAQYNKETGELIKTWESARQAGLELDIAPNAITDNCNNKVPSAGGFLWKYIIDGIIKNKIEPFISKFFVYDLDENHNLLKVWDSASCVARYWGCSISLICKRIKGFKEHEYNGHYYYNFDDWKDL